MSITEQDRKAHLIDVEGVLGNKNPRLAKLIPHFLVSYLRRIIHQDEINDALLKYREETGVEFIHNILRELGITYKVIGAENIPQRGRYIFIANHPLGGLDGMVFIAEIGRYHEEVKFIVNDLLMNIHNLNPVFIPVNKHGRQSVDYARRIEETYASDAQVLYFPAGLCSRKKKGVVRDMEWKKNFLAKAIRYRRDIVPCYFSGQNSDFFYNLSNIRTRLGIKSNIEMIYLPDEMFKQRGKDLQLHIGKPVAFSVFDERHSLQEWTDLLREHCYLLRKSVDISFTA